MTMDELLDLVLSEDHEYLPRQSGEFDNDADYGRAPTTPTSTPASSPDTRLLTCHERESSSGDLPHLAEAEIRALLRPLARTVAIGPIAGIVEEFWVPTLHTRADLVSVASELHAYEIKSDADTLRRLPSQIRGFSALFDCCSLVAAPRHVAKAAEMIPPWWGLIVAEPARTLTVLRAAGPNPGVDARLVVRLLWRDEAEAALHANAIEPDLGGGRARMWEQLLAGLDANSLRALARDAIAARASWRGQSGSSRLTVRQGLAG